MWAKEQNITYFPSGNNEQAILFGGKPLKDGVVACKDPRLGVQGTGLSWFPYCLAKKLQAEPPGQVTLGFLLTPLPAIF